jgi:2-methylcitrate dehydratase
MAKTLARKLAEYAKSLEYKNLSEKEIKEAKRRLIDTFAVSIASFNEEPIKIVRNIAIENRTEKGATLWGTKIKVPLDYVSFHNSCMTRYFDYNDTYLSKEALHPSDSIGGLFAIGENVGASGRDLILGIVLAYEIICRLADASSIRERGWDHISYIGIGGCIGMSRILNLSEEKIEQAINLTASNVITLRQTRIGELSHWKGFSAPNATRNACFYTILASKGITGPAPVFEGERGFFKQVSGEFEIEKLGGINGDFKIHETSIKYYPVEYHSMSAADAALILYNKVKYEDIEKIDIDTFEVSYKIIVKDPEKWDPKTRETADHSLPYIVAHILVNGKINIDSYSEENLKDQRVKSLMKKISIKVDPSLDKLYPKAVPNRITIYLKDGRKESSEIIYPKGHYMNPLSDEELNDKFIKLTEPFLKENSKELLKMLWNLENVKNIKEILEVMEIS